MTDFDVFKSSFKVSAWNVDQKWVDAHLIAQSHSPITIPIPTSTQLISGVLVSVLIHH